MAHRAGERCEKALPRLRRGEPAASAVMMSGTPQHVALAVKRDIETDRDIIRPQGEQLSRQSKGLPKKGRDRRECAKHPLFPHPVPFA